MKPLAEDVDDDHWERYNSSFGYGKINGDGWGDGCGSGFGDGAGADSGWYFDYGNLTNYKCRKP